MKSIVRLFFLFILLLFHTTGQAQKTYTLIQYKSKKLNKTIIAGLPVHLKAMAALYSAMGGTDCRDQECQLTTALGLGKQGSDAQKNLIKTYFPNDKVAKLVIGQDCYQPPCTSLSFSNFQSLSFIVNKDTVRVNYLLSILEHGNIKKISGPDIYIFRDQVFSNRKRILYAWMDK